MFGQGAQGVKDADALRGKPLSRRRPAQDGTGRRFQRIGRTDGRILVQGERNAAFERRSRGRDALGALSSQIFQVDVAPVTDVCGEKGRHHAQRPHSVKLVVAQDLAVDQDGPDRAAFPVGEPCERVEEHLRRAVSVAVGEQLRPSVRGEAAGVAELLRGHGRRTVSASRVRLAQEGRLLLGRPVQKDLHAGNREPLRFRKARAGLVVVGGGGIGGDVR